MNKHARELGKLGRNKPKTMTPEAIEQRRNAAKSRWLVKKDDEGCKEYRQSFAKASA